MHRLDLVGRAIRRRFLSAFRRELDRRWPGGYTYLAPDLREAVQDAWRTHRGLAVDRASRTHTGIATLLVATYDVLHELVPSRAERVEIISIALAEAGRVSLHYPSWLSSRLGPRARHRHAMYSGVRRLARGVTGCGVAMARYDGQWVLELRIDRAIVDAVCVRAPELRVVVGNPAHRWIEGTPVHNQAVRLTPSAPMFGL